ncbi:MAG TPA: 3-hydroxybutyryl-CoA dehydrogenase [Reyranella sp.]|nr:3-hydroxybutyryl-CoA dehydrogenase [Reyranella sp.]
MSASIALIGAGRMGRGLAVVFAYAGHDVALIDLKPREADQFVRLAEEARSEITGTLATLAHFGFFAVTDAAAIAGRVRLVPEAEAGAVLPSAAFIFEGVPEVLEHKRAALALVSRLAGPEPVIASTTSTILVDDLAGAIEHRERFMNAHWLNPPYLMPLVELSPGSATRPEVVQALRSLLEGIGKVTVLCAARPGYIVPRIQALAMNEAARMVEEGVASAEDIDKAVKYGFGLRFAVLGLLEFIDWGGGDILYYASRYLTKALDNERYAAPEIIERNMREGHIGMKTGRGFLDYDKIDLESHRLERLAAFATLLRGFGLVRPPVLR